MIELTEEQRRAIERRYVLVIAICVAIVAAFPALYALAATPPGSSYMGFEFGTDDHLVYTAWMRQAMDGRFLMDNRFAVDAQPGLTIHLYFFLLGQVARVTGLAFAMFLSRIGFSVLLVFLAYRLIRRVTADVYTTTLAVALTVLGGGLGFLVWHNFGRDIVRPGPASALVGGITGGHLPVDVWQPEGFVFPSMLTNNLFVVSLCLILVVFLSFLDARESWRPVLGGALAMALLMNIHSYDVLLIAMVMLAFLVMQTVRKQVTFPWVLRSLVIGAGAIPPALWFLHVLRSDPVFQSRAETLTYSATFLQLLMGYLVMVVLGLIAAVRPSADGRMAPPYRYVGMAVVALLIVALSIPARTADPGRYFLTIELWVGAFVVAAVALSLLADDNSARNLLLAWGVVGLIAPYFPALFQRKLTMGLSIPWAILAALGIAALVAHRERYSRNLATILGILVISGSSLLWVIREFVLIRGNVSNTLVHSVYLGKDSQNILKYLNDLPAGTRAVVVAPGGVSSPVVDVNNNPIPDRFAEPYMPDLNTVLSGLAGAYSYAGHWSETPDYNRRRGIVDCIGGPIFSTRVSNDVRARVLGDINPDYIVAPVPSGFPDLPLADVSSLGQIVVDGTKFRLIRLKR